MGEALVHPSLKFRNFLKVKASGLSDSVIIVFLCTFPYPDFCPCSFCDDEIWRTHHEHWGSWKTMGWSDHNWCREQAWRKGRDGYPTDRSDGEKSQFSFLQWFLVVYNIHDYIRQGCLSCTLWFSWVGMRRGEGLLRRKSWPFCLELTHKKIYTI